MNLGVILEKLPLARSVFLIYAIVGAIMLLGGTLEYGAFTTNLLAIGIACGALGVPRAITKVKNGVASANVLGFIETFPIPPVVFVVFLVASTVSLILGAIEFGAFSEDVMKIGIACGVAQAPQAIELHVAGRGANPDPAINAVPPGQ